MTKAELAKLLLESSFKESDLFWKRNSAFFLGQVVLVGFSANILTKQSGIILLNIYFLIMIAGMIIAILHRMVLESAEHYNGAWYQGFEKWVQILSQEEKNIKKAEKPWTHLAETVFIMDRLERRHIESET